jgi:hypothetical protein
MISRRALIAGALAALPVATLPGAARAEKRETNRKTNRETWKTYFNSRYGTSIEYPSRFKPGPPPDADDGLRFTADDGAELAVWASFNALDHDIPGLEDFLREGRKADEKVTYRAAGKTWLVLSGTRGDKVFYTRYLLSHRNEVENAFDLSYPAALAATYDPIVARISKSLKGGRGFQTSGKP